MVQACLIGLIASLGVFGDQLGSLYINRPIILAPLVGLVLGNLHQGLIIGASLELFFGASIPSLVPCIYPFSTFPSSASFAHSAI